MSIKQTGAPITLRIDGGTVTGALAGNATARSLVEQLPVTLSFSDYGGQEKLARLPVPLSIDGVPAGSDAVPLTIGYPAERRLRAWFTGRMKPKTKTVSISTISPSSSHWPWAMKTTAMVRTPGLRGLVAASQRG